MAELAIGVVLVGVWIVLQFIVQSPSGLIHIALAVGVVLIIRGIARSRLGLARQH